MSVSQEQNSFLYPSVKSENFNLEITKFNEFNHYKYDGRLPEGDEQEKEKQFIKMANNACKQSRTFTLEPHQQFVKNFLSSHTPYKSLLLYHGLGTGKTCSAVGVAEQFREYMQVMGYTNKIYFVASKNVQTNFRNELFKLNKFQNVVDSATTTTFENIFREEQRKDTPDLVNRFLQYITNEMTGCNSNSILKEIGLYDIIVDSKSTKDFISECETAVNKFIEQTYEMITYNELAKVLDDAFNKEMIDYDLNNSLIIIDEAHNTVSVSANEEYEQEQHKEEPDEEDEEAEEESFIPIPSGKKKELIIQKALNNFFEKNNSRPNKMNVRFLFLTATPVYDDVSEILSLINYMRKNDGRPGVTRESIFKDDTNQFTERGQDILRRAASGYVSYIRGNNPYSFPNRIWPNQFASSKTFGDSEKNLKYPIKDLWGNDISHENPLHHFSVYVSTIQEKTNQKQYEEIVKTLNDTSPDAKKQLLRRILPYLNCVPYTKYIKIDNKKYFYSDAKNSIFAPDNIARYSKKIKTICDIIDKSTGVIMIYSRFIKNGVIPMALALEEMGYTRKIGNNLFNKTENRDNDKKNYIIICGDQSLSIKNKIAKEIQAANSPENKDGSKVKVIIISQTGSEGLDFKFVRQVHIMDPWFNMSRIEQIIGRGVRFCSHQALPYDERNVQIYPHVTILKLEGKDYYYELSDLYMYRYSMAKAIAAGNVCRVIKEVAVDCRINHEQTNFTQESFNLKNVKQTLSNNKIIDIDIGDKPYSAACDYLENCSFTCKPDPPTNYQDTKETSFPTDIFLNSVSGRVIHDIKALFKENYFYEKSDLKNALKSYSEEQINFGLEELINDSEEYLIDNKRRLGHLVNIGSLYIFQPVELQNIRGSIYARSTPFNSENVTFQLKGESKPLEKNGVDIFKTLQETMNKYNQRVASGKSSQEKDMVNMVVTCRNIIQTNEFLMGSDIKIIDLMFLDKLLDQFNFQEMEALIQYMQNEKREDELTKDINELLIRKSFRQDNTLIVIYSKDDSIDEYFIRTADSGNNNWRTPNNAEKSTLKNDINGLFVKSVGKGSNRQEWVKKWKNIFPEKDIARFVTYASKIKDVETEGNTGNTTTLTGPKRVTLVTEYLNSIFKNQDLKKEKIEGLLKGINNNNLHLLFELIFRALNYLNKDNRVWYMPERIASLFFGSKEARKSASSYYKNQQN